MTTALPTEPRPAVVAIALAALANHMLTHQLPTPIGINLPTGGRLLEVQLQASAVDPWLESLQIDRQWVETAAERGSSTWDAYRATTRLPDTGHVLAIVHLVRAPGRHLEAVTSR